MQREQAMDRGRFLFIGGRWDNEIVVVDLDAALGPADIADGTQAIRARIRTTPDIDTPAGRVVASGQPIGVVFSPDHRFAYAINHSGSADPAATARFQHGYAGSIAVIDVARAVDPGRPAQAVVGLIETGTAGPVGAAFINDTTLAVASAEAEGFEDGGRTVTLIDTRDGRVVHQVPLATSDGDPCPHPAPHRDFGRYPCPNGLAFTAAHGGLILTANGGTNDVSLIALDRALEGRPDAEIMRVPVGSGAFAIAVSPDGCTAAVTERDDARTGEHGRAVALIDIAAALDGQEHAVRRIDVTPPTDTRAACPFTLAFTPDGERLLVTCFNTGTLAVIDMSVPDRSVEHVFLPAHEAGPACPRGVTPIGGGRFCAIVGGAKAGPASGCLWLVDLQAAHVHRTIGTIGNEPYLVAELGTAL